ncbi:MAG: hypothetical protein COU68_03280 [Candidatus Pacebacteria bacterium CG10_big_fil_rev_8_21_14_0_10_45_6]|nr:MAG: hypothetical protein COU68_03280 [Candidatus Pacebacteria bacterium CG10_big_fil_rev_8_21_14_0_10_45_6]
MEYVITCGDEGVQINAGTRLGIVGAGFQVEGFTEVLKHLRKSLGTDEIRIAGSAENDWMKQVLDLDTWEQVDASTQQHIAALADEHDLLYAGFLPFADPRQLKHDIKGHMVRPKKVHVANGISFTLGGGEQIYHLGRYVISAEWIASAPEALAKSVLETQVAFYTKVAGQKLLRVFEEEGDVDPDLVKKNKKRLEKLGLL